MKISVYLKFSQKIRLDMSFKFSPYLNEIFGGNMNERWNLIKKRNYEDVTCKIVFLILDILKYFSYFLQENRP